LNIKNLAASAKDKRILVLSPTTSGKNHDKKIQAQEDLMGGIPDEIPVLVDSGFQGVQKQYVNKINLNGLWIMELLFRGSLSIN
jgi:hypothetical protein